MTRPDCAAGEPTCRTRRRLCVPGVDPLGRTYFGVVVRAALLNSALFAGHPPSTAVVESSPVGKPCQFFVGMFIFSYHGLSESSRKGFSNI